MTNPPRLPDPRMIPSWEPGSWFVAEEGAEAGAEPAQATDQEPPEPDGDSFLRPFILTQGRTRPLHDGLRVETLILAAPSALSAPTRYERRRILELCQHPMSLAEVAVALAVPLGVARVLIADLFTDNLISLRAPTELPLPVIERIRDLVREL